MAKTNIYRKATAVGGMSLVLAGGLAPLAMTEAHAAPVAIVDQVQNNPGAMDDSAFWNRFQLSNGDYAFCNGDPQDPAALNAFGYDDDNYRTVQGAFTALGGTAWNDEQGKAAGYLLSKYGADLSVDPAAVQYAVMSLASPYYPGSGIGLSQAQIDKGEELKAEALANYGSYVDFKLAEPTITVNNEARTATLATNLSGGNYSVTYTLTGLGTFEDGTQSKTVSADTAEIAIVIPADAQAGDVAVTADVSNIPNTAFTIMESPEHQDLFIAGKTISATATAVAAFAPVVAPAPEPTPTPAPKAPEVTTVASDDVQLTDGKAEIWDTAKVTGDVPEGAYMTVKLYKLSDSTDQKKVLADNPQCTDDSLVAETKRIDVTGAGDYTTEKITVTSAGTYGFVETLYDKDGNILDQGLCGEESETVVVTEAPKPVETTPAPTPTPTPVEVKVDNSNSNENNNSNEQSQNQEQSQSSENNNTNNVTVNNAVNVAMEQSQKAKANADSVSKAEQSHALANSGGKGSSTQAEAIAKTSTTNASATSSGASTASERSVAAKTGITSEASALGLFGGLAAVMAGFGLALRKRIASFFAK